MAIFDYVRYRSSQRRDFALMASALGFPLGITLLRSFHPIESGLMDVAGAFALFAQPYFLFRLLQYFRPSQRGVGPAIIVGFLLSCALLLTQMRVNPALTVTVIFTYCAIVEAYCTLGYYESMRATAGTLRVRLRIITISSAVFTLAFIINAVKAQFPALAITPIAQAAAAVSALFFYVAFLPPRWLRRAWQMEALHDYVSQAKRNPASDTFVIEHLQELSESARQATNGLASAVLKSNESAHESAILTATDKALFVDLLEKGPSLLERARQERRAFFSFVSDIPEAGERRLLRTLDVNTWLLVPVQGQERLWGLLIVALKDRSLFIEDDLKMLDLLVQECALVLDNHRLVEELQNYSGQLEQMVDERTEALQRSNEELRRFAYVASHDLQEPLRTVTSYVQLIEQRFADKLGDEGREFVAFSVDGALHMKNVISDLLMFSRVEARSRTFTLLDLEELLDNIKRSLEVLIFETDTTITHDPLPQLIADEALMLQIFQNLIGNAIKYRSAKKPEIHISVSCEDRQWMFAIRDNGIGMEQQYLERIFIIFQRLHTRDKYSGTGIGLAVCKKAVELHNGRIWAESEVGEGTTFHFTIPVRELIQGITEKETA